MADTFSCLVVDDETDIRELLVITLNRMGVKAEGAANVDDAKFMLRQKRYSLCLTDMRLPDGNGLDLVRHINQHYAGLPIAVITAHGSADNAVSALKAGAFDYITKPISLQQLRPLVQAALKMPGPEATTSLTIAGESPVIKEVRNTLAKLSRNQAPVFITGEPGTGKDLVARIIHLGSPRHENPFIIVDCSTIDETRIDETLFGNAEAQGAFQKAAGGTLLLKEVGTLPLPTQVRLLEAIQDKRVHRDGRDENVDVRLISTSQRNIATLMDKGLFRQDLYYRLNVVSLALPALRQIPEDIPTITRHLLKRFCKPRGIEVPALTKEAQQILANHHYPGNVRELETILERALTLYDGKTITPADLRLPSEARAKPVELAAMDMPLPEYLESIEKQAILNALEKTGNNKTAAAKLLGVSFRTLRYRLSKLGLGKDQGLDGGDAEDEE